MNKLPNDDRRIKRAQHALDAYKQQGFVEPEYAMRDLITDLLHLMYSQVENQHDVEHEHMMAVGNFIDELEELGAPAEGGEA